MELKIPDKLLEENMGELLFGKNGFHFYRKEEIEKGQIGYRYNSDGKKIEEWLGDQYVVIGYETLLGDPILVDTSDENLPVYHIFHDDWSYLFPIANSMDDYRKILRMVLDCDLSEKEVIDQLIVQIKEINQGIAIDYWSDLLYSTYEDLAFCREGFL